MLTIKTLTINTLIFVLSIWLADAVLFDGTSFIEWGLSILEIKASSWLERLVYRSFFLGIIQLWDKFLDFCVKRPKQTQSYQFYELELQNSVAELVKTNFLFRFFSSFLLHLHLLYVLQRTDRRGPDCSVEVECHWDHHAALKPVVQPGGHVLELRGTRL